MSGTGGIVTGCLAAAVVLVLGVIGRRPVHRTPPGLPALRPTTPPRSNRRRSVLLLSSVGVVAVVAAALAGAFATVVVAGSVGALVVRRRRVEAAAQRRRVDAAMPDAIELLVLCVHAGSSPTQAVVELAARAPPVLRPTFAAVDLHLHRGRSLAAALSELAKVGGSSGRDVATAIATADRDGLPLAPVLDRLALEARATRRRHGEAAARRLPVRLTFPLVTCTLPSFVLLAIAPALLGALSTLRAEAP